jgi:hypothetical protein
MSDYGRIRSCLFDYEFPRVPGSPNLDGFADRGFCCLMASFVDPAGELVSFVPEEIVLQSGIAKIPNSRQRIMMLSALPKPDEVFPQL